MPLELLDIRETMKIIVEHTHWTEGRGYNMTWGGGSTFGRPCSEKTRKKISASNKGKKTGIKHSKDRCENISKGLMGHFVSDYTKKRVSETKKGVPLTDEVKKKMSDAHKGKKFTDEHKKKIGDSKIGKKRPDVSERNRKYDYDMKRKAIKLKKKGNTLKNISSMLGISYSTIQGWVKNEF